MSGFQGRRRSLSQQAAALLAAIIAAQHAGESLPVADVSEDEQPYPVAILEWTRRDAPMCGSRARTPLTGDRMVGCTLNTGHPGRHLAGVSATTYGASWE